MTEVDYYLDPETGVEYRVKEVTHLDIERRTASHVRSLSTHPPGGVESTRAADIRIEVDPLVGRLPGDRCWERCTCPGGKHVEEDDDD
jgi:hypothetical protein